MKNLFRAPEPRGQWGRIQYPGQRYQATRPQSPTPEPRGRSTAKVLVTCLLLSTSTQPGRGAGWVWGELWALGR